MTTLSTGFPGFDECLDGGLHSDGLVVVTGPPASGKTTFTTFLIKQALQQGLSAHLINLEDTATAVMRQLSDTRRFTFESVWDEASVFRAARKVDLLVIDNLNLARPYQDSAPPTPPVTPRWMGNVAHAIAREQRSIRVITVPAPRISTDMQVAPKLLNYSASVIFRLTRTRHDVMQIQMTKNRYGTLGNPVDFTLPEVRPFIRRSLWQRILEDIKES